MDKDGLHFVVEADRVWTHGFGSIGQADLVMRATTATEVAQARQILLRLATYVVSCGTRIDAGDTFVIDDEGDVTLEAAPGGRLEVVWKSDDGGGVC